MSDNGGLHSIKSSDNRYRGSLLLVVVGRGCLVAFLSSSANLFQRFKSEIQNFQVLQLFMVALPYLVAEVVSRDHSSNK
jgi:hypothetical protein